MDGGYASVCVVDMQGLDGAVFFSEEKIAVVTSEFRENADAFSAERGRVVVM